MKKKLLILQARPDDITKHEFEALLKYGDLEEEDVHRIRMEEQGIPKLNLDEYWGLIIGGSPFNVASPEEKKSESQRRLEPQCRTLLEEVVARDFPSILNCYGHAIVSGMFGGLVEQSPEYAETPGAVTLTLTDEGLNEPLLDGFPKEFKVFAGHSDSCTKLPENAVLLASSEKCPVHMFKIKENIYSTQFHVELDVPGICARIDTYKREKKYFDSVEQAMEIRGQMSKEDVTVPMEILKRFVKKYKEK